MAADELHIIPVNDLIDHAETDDCVCGPKTYPGEGPDGAIGWLIAHNSLDGRELDEPDRMD